MDEILSAIVYGAAIFGAFLSTWVGKKNSGQAYDINQFMSSLIIASLMATATVQIEILQEQLSRMGYIGIGVFYVAAGFFVDKGLSRLDKGKNKPA